MRSGTVVTVPGVLHAALQVCHPGGLPAWLVAATPRCATATSSVLQLDEHQEQQLADLVAAAWWECLQDAPSDPFTTAFADACRTFLTPTEGLVR